MRASRLRPLPRVRYANGDLVAAADLSAEFAAECAQRAIHVRALHRTWGIALGFAAGVTNAGDRLVVGPGLAYDVCGRELAIDHPIVFPKPVPPAGAAGIGWWFDVVLNGARTPSLRYAFAGVQLNVGSPAPMLSNDVRLGEDVPVARVLLAAGAMAQPTFAFRRAARGVGARVVTGRIPAGHAIAQSPRRDRWTCSIDFADAHFTEPPFVFATLEQHPLLGVIGAAQMSSILGPFVHVGAATTMSALVSVRFALAIGSGFVWPAGSITTLPVPIRWRAIAAVRPPVPVIRLGEARSPSGEAEALATPDLSTFGAVLPGGTIQP
ncbi:MAG TPA: hypothetical protein VNC18_15345 [Gemmatimonadaceae bacterium]|jgi:hypothetical protein|nr:hypothetical protein [Gemmatimonadaceae bacterium]